MNSYKVNLDYESYLFDPNYKENSTQSNAFIKEFEYVFFLINNKKCILKNIQKYNKEYLEKLKALECTIPILNSDEESYQNWWGLQKNKRLEQELNSKLTSAKLALDNNWGMFNGSIVQSAAEANEWIKKYHVIDWIIKSPFGVSGSGHSIYKGQEFSGPQLLEPIHQRVFDIGTTFEVSDGKLTNIFMVENLNSKNGSFKGGIAGSEKSIFKNYIFKKYNFDLTELEEITKKIFNKYKEMGACSNIQIDSFVYLDNNKLKLYPLVEVNYRKTMGLVLQNLTRIMKVI